MAVVMLYYGYDGIAGIVDTPDDLDLAAAHVEFLAAYLPQFMIDHLYVDELSEDYLSQYFDKVNEWREKIKKEEYKSVNIENLFIEWLERYKGSKRIEYASFNIDEWKYNK